MDTRDVRLRIRIKNTRPIELWTSRALAAVRSAPIVLAASLIAWSADSSEPQICYSKFSPSKKPEFKHALTEQLKKLYDALGDAYNDDTPVVDIPIVSEGNVYLASTCEYAASLQQSLDKSILFTRISKDEYEHQDDLRSQSGRIIRRERN